MKGVRVTLEEYNAKLDEVANAVQAQWGDHNSQHTEAVVTFIQVAKDRIAHLFEAPFIEPYEHLTDEEKAETTPKLHLKQQVEAHAAIAGSVPASE